jgi:hypothetical protein
VTEPLAHPAVTVVRTLLPDINARIARWAEHTSSERELGARATAELLYHLLAAALLLGEGHVLHARSGDFRKFVVAALYVRRWLRPAALGEAAFAAAQLASFDRLADWQPVDAAALAAATA